MVKLPKILDTPEDFNDMVNYLQQGIFAEKYNSTLKKSNFQRKCKNFVYDQQTSYLFFKQPSNDNSPPIKKRVVPIYDFELRETLFEKFHVDSAHFEYHKTYIMIYEQYIGIIQDDVENGPLEHLQVDLVDLLSYAEYNDGYSYVLTLIDIFSHYVWAIPLKDKEGNTIHGELVNIFKNFGPPTKLQADNRSEFITSVLKKTCNAFEIKLVHGHARHPQSQGKIERFNQTLSRHLTKMMWDEISGSQGYRWVDVLPQFVIAYNKAPHEAHKKSLYEAFFGFKMRAVYNTLNTPENKDNTLETNTPGTNTPGTISPEHIPPEHIPPRTITPGTIPLGTILPGTILPRTISPGTIPPENAASQDNKALYEFHAMQVKCVHNEVAQNDEAYQNKIVIRGSVHRKKVTFEPGDKVAVAPDFDNNQKMRKHKLEQTCSITRKVVSVCNNNRMVRVDVNGEIKNFVAKNLKRLHK
ncbi:SCAN domain-containing protein 3-like [Gigaspora margarita]|uniref:SCAN domain-containing protein 3-like n=1 Tax=Gigaspora margarita TaxID=4874 RepID=A0A8H3X3Z1_GIGMA|nr:SCAN domain-containing protein 3-like [Gigaspora margarita]